MFTDGLPWNERWPDAFEISGVDECPMQMIGGLDPWTAKVCGIVQDWRVGLVPGWPDAYTAGVVSAVRYLLGEIEACKEWVHTTRS